MRFKKKRWRIEGYGTSMMKMEAIKAILFADLGYLCRRGNRLPFQPGKEFLAASESPLVSGH